MMEYPEIDDIEEIREALRTNEEQLKAENFYTPANIITSNDIIEQWYDGSLNLVVIEYNSKVGACHCYFQNRDLNESEISYPSLNLFVKRMKYGAAYFRYRRVHDEEV